MNLPDKKIVILAGPGTLTNIFFHGIDRAYPVHKILVEEKPSATSILKRRIKKLGFFRVFGQLIFQLFIYKLIVLFSKKRKAEILALYRLSESPVPTEKIISVKSVNAPETIELLKNLQPDLIFISGTRIISEKTLSSVNAFWINIHTGITPMYRGVHGGYWALVNQEKQHCGVTIHFVDKGIDTGSIIAQDTIRPETTDNFSTYPYLQYAAGINLILKGLRSSFDPVAATKLPTGPSALWYHPTAGQYLGNLFNKKIK